MNAKSLRVLIRALKGRSLKTVAAAEPDAVAWHLLGSVPNRSFILRTLPAKVTQYAEHVFDVRKGNVTGTVITHNMPGRNVGIRRVASTARDSMGHPVPLDLGVKGYRRLFRGIRSTLGVPSGTHITFERARNIFNPASRKYIKRESSALKLR